MSTDAVRPAADTTAPGAGRPLGAAPARPPHWRFQAPHYEPPYTPHMVRRHGALPDTLPVGRPGKVGLLELGFEKIGHRTELVHHFQKSPLQIMRPLYYDPGRPDIPITCLMSTGGGIVQADRLRTDLHLGADACVLVTTQAATKIYQMEFDYATQQFVIDIGACGYLELMPGPTIPYSGSRYYQRTRITADPTASVLVGDTFLTGRLARQERNAYSAFASDFELRRPSGELVALDTMRLAPDVAAVSGPAVLGSHDAMATFFVASPLAPASDLAAQLDARLARTGLLYGVSVLPQDCGAWARIMGSSSADVSQALTDAWDAIRRRLIDVPAPAMRKS